MARASEAHGCALCARCAGATRPARTTSSLSASSTSTCPAWSPSSTPASQRSSFAGAQRHGPPRRYAPTCASRSRVLLSMCVSLPPQHAQGRPGVGAAPGQARALPRPPRRLPSRPGVRPRAGFRHCRHLTLAGRHTGTARPAPSARRAPTSQAHAMRLRAAAAGASAKALRACLEAGVGFHHAAMEAADRELVERLFLSQDLPVRLFHRPSTAPRAPLAGPGRAHLACACTYARKHRCCAPPPRWRSASTSRRTSS